MTTFRINILAIAIAGIMSSATVDAETLDNIQTDQDIENISILGSRASNRTATESASPIDLIDGESLSKGGFTELGQSLQATAPSFNFSRTQVSDGSDLFRPATLRGLQPDQTLVLINGKRRHNQAIFGVDGTVGAGSAGTDMNAIPLSALKNVQVLRDGAAAQYGSDAIAGVINLELKDSTDQTSVYIQSGATGAGDGEVVSIGLNTGVDLGQDGGFINVSLEGRDYGGTNRAQRDIGGGSSVPFGTLSDKVRWSQGNAKSEFGAAFYNMMLPVNESELYSFGGYSHRTALGNGFYRGYDAVAKNIPQLYPDGFLPLIDNKAQDISFAIGLRGELNDQWEFDISGVYGENTYDFYSKNTINASYAGEYLSNNPGATAADIAANAGPTQGYSGGFEFDQLTLNIDISGEVDVDLNDLLYVSFGAEYRKENYNIVAGEQASYACGIANEDMPFPSVIDGSALAECGFQAYPGLRPSASNKDNRASFAFYLDIESQLSQQWLIGTALRYEDFSDSGEKLIAKLSSRFNISDDFSLRGAVSTGFRAPSLQQSAYTAYTTTMMSPSFTATAGSPFPSALGVDGLALESSENLSLGLVYDLTEDLTITLDAYRVKIEDRITLGSMLSPDDVAFNSDAVAALNAIGAAQANYFSNSVNSTTKGIDLIVSYHTSLNQGQLNITFAGNVNETAIDAVNAPAGIPKTVALDDLQRSFLTDGQPKQRATLTFDYAKDAFSAVIRANYFGETDILYFGNDHVGLPGFLSPTGSFKPSSVVEAAVLIDINIGYQITESLAISAGVNNLFDQTPDELGADEALDFITNQAFRYPVRALPYGFDGLSYYTRINYKF